MNAASNKKSAAAAKQKTASNVKAPFIFQILIAIVLCGGWRRMHVHHLAESHAKH